jgi:hypothetical protein
MAAEEVAPAMSIEGCIEWGVAAVLALAALVIALLVFLFWLFWTFSGMLMDWTGTTKYGWVFQLVITLIVFSMVGSIGGRVSCL